MPRGIKPKDLQNLPDDMRYLAHIAAGPNPGYLYFLISDQLGVVKIGASNRWEGHQVAVDKRITEVKNASPLFPIDREFVLLAGPVGMSESAIHDHFKDYRIGKSEWFIYCDDLKGFVDSVGRLLEEFEKWKNDEIEMPTEKPWALLRDQPKPPSKKFVRLHAEFEDCK